MYASAMLTTVGVLKHSLIGFRVSPSTLVQYGVNNLAFRGRSMECGSGSEAVGHRNTMSECMREKMEVHAVHPKSY